MGREVKFNARVEEIVAVEPKPGAPEFVHVVARASSGVPATGAARRFVRVMLEKNSNPWKIGDRCRVEEIRTKDKHVLRLIER